jgi:repressor LexA
MNKIAEFSDRLNEAMKFRDVSATELGARIGMSKQAISMYSSGKRHPKQPTIEAIARILKINPAWLIGYDVSKDMPSPVNVFSYASLPDIPVIGVIHAGQPILAQENIKGYEKSDVKNPDEYFYLYVEGDCMIGAGIAPGSRVLIHKQNYAENGQIVACLVDGNDATLKKYTEKKDTVVLTPSNPAYEPIIVSKRDFYDGYAKILGVAKEVLTKL